MERKGLSRLRALTGSDTGRAAELGIAAMVGNVMALAFTLVFTRVLGQSGYGSLGALISTFLLLTVAGYALQTTVAREVSGAIAAGDPDAGRGVRRWLQRLVLLAIGMAALGVIARRPLATAIGVEDVPWGAAATLPAGALWLVLSVERGALLGFQRYRLVGVSLVAEQTARLVFGVLLAVAGFDVAGAFVGTPLALAAIAAALWVPLHRQVAGTSDIELPGHRLRDLFRRAWAPICALGLISWLQDGNVIVVKHLASDHEAGAWVAAAVAAKAIMWIAIGLSAFLVPEVARRAGHGEDARPILLRVIALVGALAVPMVLVYAVAAGPILHKVLHVHGAENALPFFGLAMSMLALTYLATQYQLALHRSRFLVVLALAGLAQPLIMVAVGGSRLTALALGLLGLHIAVAAVMMVLALRRGAQPGDYVDEVDDATAAAAAAAGEPVPPAPTAV
jgi:O-antigen/teichoic acid export membrane protein